MREITVRLYQFDELDDKGKERARDWARNDEGMRSQWAFEGILEDAKQVGLDIHELDFHRANSGEFVTGALDCARAIRKEHGKACGTWRTVNRYWKGINSNDEAERENSEHELLHDLLEDYRIMFDKEVEYAYGTEAIEEDIRANEYEFTEDGKRA